MILLAGANAVRFTQTVNGLSVDQPLLTAHPAPHTKPALTNLTVVPGSARQPSAATGRADTHPS